MFNPLSALAVHQLRPRLKDKPTVVELGNQRFGAAGAVPGTEQIASTKEYYLHLGFSEYLAIDVNTAMDAVVMDLNKSVKRDHNFTRQFDLVTNCGTGEHIFDQRMVFENVHDMCAAGGIMLHSLPMLPWLNHGFFNYTPVLFRDLAAANGYAWEMLWLSDRWGKRVDITGKVEMFKEKRPVELQQAIGSGGFNGDIFIVAALRKMKEEPFRVPLQGKYQQDVADEGLQQAYRTRA